MNSIIILMV